ncbi:MAG: porphobilinogen synthase [Methylotenera sp.]|nr:porphobilinogen synthase [Oligoflexia bacterium]
MAQSPLNSQTVPMTLRRLRQSALTRQLVREIRVTQEQLIQPHFVIEGLKTRETIPGLTGVHRETPDTLLHQVEKDLEAGVNKLLLFSVPAKKALQGFDSSFTAGQIRALKQRFGNDLWVSVDVCLCSSTSHGQCGVLNPEGNHVENSSTVGELARAALAFSEAGADCVAPSDMMDGRIAAIRKALDSGVNPRAEHTLIMSYSAKFHSRFYGPFRAAADSAPKGGGALKDRATYQIDPGRPSDALLSSLRDVEEGADILMVKPALPYLDVLKELSQKIHKPWAVYEVSGEFAAIELMAAQGMISGPQAHLESWISCIRAGASMIITYGARESKEWLKFQDSL